jgi:hypothetical protein
MTLHPSQRHAPRLALITSSRAASTTTNSPPPYSTMKLVGCVVAASQTDTPWSVEAMMWVPSGEQAPAPANTGLFTTPTGHDGHQLLKLPDRQTREYRHPLGPVRPDHLLHTMVNDQEFPSLRDNL